MANVKDRITALEKELQQLRSIETWGVVGRDLREFFTEKHEEDDDKLYVTIGVETDRGEGVRDWKIPYQFISEALAKVGSQVQQKIDGFAQGQKSGR